MIVAYVGIDPGSTGAVAAVDADGAPLGIWDAPLLEVVKDGRRRTEPDVAAMGPILWSLGEKYDVRRVVLEKVQPMPRRPKKGGAVDARGEGETEGWGALPNFVLGLWYGLWWGQVLAVGLPLDRLAPQSWRARMLAGMPQGKEAGRMKALELFPALQAELKLKKHHGRADALLMAECARRIR